MQTLVFVSHDLDAVTQFCDRALLLENGRVQALGPAENVVAEYAERALAASAEPRLARDA